MNNHIILGKIQYVGSVQPLYLWRTDLRKYVLAPRGKLFKYKYVVSAWDEIPLLLSLWGENQRSASCSSVSSMFLLLSSG